MVMIEGADGLGSWASGRRLRSRLHRPPSDAPRRRCGRMSALLDCPSRHGAPEDRLANVPTPGRGGDEGRGVTVGGIISTIIARRSLKRPSTGSLGQERRSRTSPPSSGTTNATPEAPLDDLPARDWSVSPQLRSTSCSRRPSACARRRVAPRAAEVDRTSESLKDLRRVPADQDILALPFSDAHGGAGGELLSG